MICLLFRVLDFLLMPRFKIATALHEDLGQAVIRELQPPIADRATLTELLVRRKWQPACGKERAALWVDLVCGDARLIDRRQLQPRTICDPVEQWETVYGDTPMESMN